MNFGRAAVQIRALMANVIVVLSDGIVDLADGIVAMPDEIDVIAAKSAKIQHVRRAN